MQIRRRAITAGTTLILAAAAGHMMHNAETIAAQLRSDAPRAEPVVTHVESTAAVLVPPGEKAVSALPLTRAAVSVPQRVVQPFPADLPAVQPISLRASAGLAARIAALDDGPVSTESAADAEYSAFGVACEDKALTLDTVAPAMLRITLAAPCHLGERVTIRHAGLSFVAMTDRTGNLDLTMPAFAAVGEVSASFAGEPPLSAHKHVAGLDAFTRIAVRVRGTSALRLHVFEDGATFGGPGHVTADRRGLAGGFMMLLGDPALEAPVLTEVYSAPSATRLDALELEAAVTAETCGRWVTADRLRMVPGAAPDREMLRLAMPGCDAVGDVVVMALATEAGPRLAAVPPAN